jgi:hypothetical protein
MAGCCKNKSNLFKNLNICDSLINCQLLMETLCRVVNHIFKVPFIKAHMFERQSMSLFYKVVRSDLIMFYKLFNKVVSLLYRGWLG